MANLSLIRDLHSFYKELPRRRRLQMILLLPLLVAGAVSEMVSLGAIVPFLAFLVDPIRSAQNPYISELISLLGWGDSRDIGFNFTMLFAAIALCASGVRFLLNYAIAKYNFGVGHDIGVEVYRRALYQPYQVHVARNTSDVIGGIVKVDTVVYVAFSLLNAISSAFLAVCIFAAMIVTNPTVAGIAFIGFGSIYIPVSLFTSRLLTSASRAINHASTARVQAMQEGLGGIRDVILDQAQDVFSRRFEAIDGPMRRAQASVSIIGPSPRLVVEAVGMVLIACLGYYMTSTVGGIAAAIPALGVLVLGAQRLMPLLQQVYQGWVYVKGSRDVLRDVVLLLRQPVVADAQSPDVRPLPFLNELRLDQVSFRYDVDSPYVIRDVNMLVKRGERIGIIGATGSGKSTVVDLLMGLLLPSTGKVEVDGGVLGEDFRGAWQRNIAHVPQSIFLLDASFAENIAFGAPIDRVDLARVREVANLAQIADFIESTPLGYRTSVGERGVRLSGGQRQRIGIARALYKQADVLIFDEATSALDSDTEDSVMRAIMSLNRNFTVILIAHRVTTLRSCDVIYRVEDGQVERVGSFSDITRDG